MYAKQWRQRKIENILFHTATTAYATQFYEPYIPSNQPNKHNLNNQKDEINVGFITKAKFMLFHLRQRKFWGIHNQRNWPILFMSFITNLYTSSIAKNLNVAWWTISYVSSIPTQIRYLFHS